MNPNGIVTTTNCRSLDYTLNDLRRRFGATIITKLGDQPPPVAVISTGFPALDHALGIGGLPRGRIIDIYGPESSGKTTLCLHVIAQAQKLLLTGNSWDGSCVFIDTEHALDPPYAAKCGVDLNRLYLAQPDTGEEALEIAEGMVRGGAAVVIIDSAAAVVPRAEIEGEMGDNHAGLQSRLMSQAMRKLAAPVHQNSALLIFTNQLRYNPQVLFGNPEQPTGGLALRFHASIRISLSRLQTLKSNGEAIGCRIRAVIKKNKLAPPFRSAELDLIW